MVNESKDVEYVELPTTSIAEETGIRKRPSPSFMKESAAVALNMSE